MFRFCKRLSLLLCVVFSMAARAAEGDILERVAWLEHSLVEPMPKLIQASQMLAEAEYFEGGVTSKNRFHYWFDAEGRLQAIASWYEGHFDQRVRYHYKSPTWMQAEVLDQAGLVLDVLDYRLADSTVQKTRALADEERQLLAEYVFSGQGAERLLEIRRTQHKLRYRLSYNVAQATLEYQEWDGDYQSHIRYRFDSKSGWLTAVEAPQAKDAWRAVATFEHAAEVDGSWSKRQKLDAVSAAVLQRVSRRFLAAD